jgi:anti-anti-sigma factor
MMVVEVRASRSQPDVSVVSLSGRLDLEAVEADSPALLQALQQSAAGIIVDLGGVEFISSSGLRMLLAADGDAQGSGKRVALVRAQPSVYKIFKVAGLGPKFRFFDDENAAVQALW